MARHSRFCGYPSELGLAVLTDVHENDQCVRRGGCRRPQIPAFLSRQTDLLVAAARTGKTVNVRRAVSAPRDMVNAVEKITGAGNPNVLLPERGASLPSTLVSDMRALPIMARTTGAPVI